MNKQKLAVLSLSGGLDSSTLLLHLLANGYNVTALSFDYGQKHRVELERAQDLVKYIPYFDTEFIDGEKINMPVSEIVQLLYVLPNQSLHLLPKEINEKVDKTRYPTDCDFVWAYCRYFWEAHVELPELDIDELAKESENV